MKYKSEAHFQAVRKESMKRFKELYPEITETSGIYLFSREQQVGDTVVKYGYIGQAKNLLSRIVGHMISPKTHIDRSLIKRKMKHKGGEWSVEVIKFCPDEWLDFCEKQMIESYITQGWQLPYNKTLGGQSGKETVADHERKGYVVGTHDGEERLLKKLVKWFNLEALPAAFKNDGGLYAEPKRLLETYEDVQRKERKSLDK